MASVRGLAAVSLNDIAGAVGLSKSGVFKHFGDKEDLHLAVLEASVRNDGRAARIWSTSALIESATFCAASGEQRFAAQAACRRA